MFKGKVLLICWLSIATFIDMSCQRKIEHSKLAQISSNMHPLTIIWIPVPEEDPCSGEVLIVISSLFGMHLRPMTMKLKILIKRIKGTCMSYSYMVQIV